MDADKVVLITGATGNLGGKLRRHLQGRYPLRLLDRDARGDAEVHQADLSCWDPSWADLFRGVHTVFHLAADPTAQQTWTEVIAPNLDALVHVYSAAVRASVKRVVFASSNHVMGGYQDDLEPFLLTTDVPPRPGTRYLADGQSRDSTPYASAKLFGERLGKCFAEAHGLSSIAVRLGWNKPGENPARGIPLERGEWFRLMWLSNRDYTHLMECCLVADEALRFAIINGMSANTGMRWDLKGAGRLVGYQPQDDVTRG
jgi:NAD+ dependent glucose-6-phosphate dehydrogenase